MRADIFEFIFKVRILIAFIEVFNSPGIFNLDLSLGFNGFVVFHVIIFLAFNTHDAHEVVSRVAELRAFELYVVECNGGKVVNSEFCLIKVDDFALSKQHQPIEQLEDIRIWLMDSTDNCSPTHSEVSQGFND